MVIPRLKKIDIKTRKWLNPYRVKREAKEFILRILTAILMIGISYVILAPLIGMISTSFMTVEDLFNPMVFMVPENPTLYNVRSAVLHLRFWDSLWYTLRYAGGLALLHVLVASLVGYGFARFKFYGSKLIFGLVLLTFIIPPQVYMVPLWFTFRFFGPTDINLINNYTSVIMLTLTGMGLRSGLFIFIFRQFFMGVPRELSEAATIDGCGPLRTFALVMMPNAKPAIVTVFMFGLIWHYGDTFYSGLLLNRPRLIHNSLGLAIERWRVHNANVGGVIPVFNDFEIIYAQMMFYSSILLIVIPILIIYAIMQRQFIEGIERSGIVG